MCILGITEVLGGSSRLLDLSDMVLECLPFRGLRNLE